MIAVKTSEASRLSRKVLTEVSRLTEPSHKRKPTQAESTFPMSRPALLSDPTLRTGFSALAGFRLSYPRQDTFEIVISVSPPAFFPCIFWPFIPCPLFREEEVPESQGNDYLSLEDKGNNLDISKGLGD